MRPSLSHKMLVSFLSVALVAALVPVVLTILFFEQGMVRMTEQYSMYRLSTIRNSLETQYDISGGWAFLWSDGTDANTIVDRLRYEYWDDKLPLSEEVRTSRFTVKGPWWVAAAPQLTIYDAEGNFLAGNESMGQGQPRVALFDDGGSGDTVIGYLAKFDEYPFLASERTWKQFFYSTALGLVLIISLCAFCVWWLSRHFRTPIDHINAASTRLAAGQLDTRVEVTRDDELGELEEHFNHMAHAIEEQENLRRQWIANTSHELRTPLTVALGTVQGMRAGILPTNEEQLEQLSQSIQELDALVEDLHALSASNVQAWQFTLSELALEPLFAQLQQNFSQSFAEAGLQLDIDLASAHEITLEADPARIKQVMQNILANSLRYTHAPGTTHVYATASPDTITMICEDSSPCPNPEDMGRIFDRFFRCEPSRSRNLGGTGLGLSICEHIVSCHQGRISATASSLGGLRIQIDLPRIASPAPAPFNTEG